MRHHASRRRLIATTIGVAAATATTLVAQAPQVGAATAGSQSTYLVVYVDGASSSAATTAVTKAGGTLVANYSQIGVVVARSASAGFSAAMSQVSGVAAATRTDNLATRVQNDVADAGQPADPGAPVADTDSLSGLQWDMAQIHTPQAHTVTGGSSNVVVGDIDTGLDWTHPDLAPNVDFSRSASCVSGVADFESAAWMDDNGHGTHTAGTIAAAANGIGIVGVAPGVRLAGIKAGNAAGYFFPESVVCAFMWAAGHGIAVTNNSYFADPWLFNCANDPAQRAIWLAERRAVSYAQSKGVVVVSAEGNESDDLAHPTQDVTSPDDSTPVSRAITNACKVVPVELPGVIGVTATGNLHEKSFYSSYGTGVADVAAPGGDSLLQLTAAAPNGRVLSTWPAALLAVTCLPARRVVDASGATYCYQQGTSMASPHVAGVAALIASVRGLTGGTLAAAVQQATNPIACPTDTSGYAPFPSVSNGAPQTCSGGATSNGWYGRGEVDALKAVS